MQYLKQSYRALLLLALTLPPSAQATFHFRQRGSLADELEATYPTPPKGLDTDPTVSSVLLIDFDLKGALGRVDGAALMPRGNGGEPIRAARMKGDLVMFHTLAPGTYSLRFIRVENLNPWEILVLEKPTAIEINVTVAAGGLHYLGTVVVSRKKFGLFGFKPPEFQLIYDARREREAWSAFKKKYADTPWAMLAERRISSPRSPDAEAQPQTPSPPRDSVIHVACMLAYVDEFKQEGNDEQKAQLMASLVCQVFSGGCQNEPRGEPCKNTIRHLSDALEKSGQSLPLMAARAGRTDLINTLVEVGADINKPAVLGWTPLMFAAAEGHPETVSALLEAGADVNATNGPGRTALMFAASYGFVAIVKDLLAHRADPNIVPKDSTGWTALIAAAHKGHIDVVSVLLGHGADVSIKDKDGKTALLWAEAQGHADVAQVLRDAATRR
jgi:ankyrin repeat protein